MLNEEKEILDLFDEFYLIMDEEKIQPVKGKEISKITKSEFNFNGTNKHKTVFVYNDKNQLSENDHLMLENLVTKGIGWDMNDLVLLDLNKNKFATLPLIKEFFHPKQLVFWGCEEFLSVNKIPQKLHEVLKGKEINVLTVQDISYYQTSDQKKLLWKSIQQLLGL